MHEMRRADKAITDRGEIDEILGTAQVCHLALKDEPFPYVVPLNYGYGRLTAAGAGSSGDAAAGGGAGAPTRDADVTPGAAAEPGATPALFFHGASSGRKLELMRRDPRAAFVVDIDHELITDSEACRFTMYYRSVMGTGRIRFLEGIDEKRYALNCIMKQYTGRDDWSFPDRALEAMALYALVIEEMTGKRSPAKAAPS